MGKTSWTHGTMAEKVSMRGEKMIDKENEINLLKQINKNTENSLLSSVCIPI